VVVPHSHQFSSPWSNLHLHSLQVTSSDNTSTWLSCHFHRYYNFHLANL
jgi:hypothetical protein